MIKNDIIRALDENARLTPEKTAFTEAGGRSLSWKELRDAAFSVASALIKDGRDSSLPVAVTVGRDLSGVVSILGCVAAGRWYVPVDGELPADRIRTLIDVADPEIIITESADVDFGDRTVIVPSKIAAVSDPELSERDPDLPMFGIFTSGSTGTPKLVVKSASAMISFICAYVKEFGFGRDEVFGNQIPFYFDASTKDLFSTVMLGATCVVIPQKHFSFPVGLIGILNDYKVSSIVWVPSALSIAARFNVFAAAKPESVKKILFVGERMPVKYLNAWMEALPDAEFVNLYGSTEVAGNSCFYRVPRGLPDDASLPIGRPFEGIRVFLSDGSGSDADEGEIAVAGPWLAEGYWRDAEKTASVFRETTIGDFTGRVYFSGDYGRRNPDGTLVCVSRKDSQIKHMGHRIELGEIEISASALPYVREACCVYDGDAEKIILFFSCAQDEDYAKKIRADLSRALPKYMIPHIFRASEELPHNRNGKIDRKALAAQAADVSRRK